MPRYEVEVKHMITTTGYITVRAQNATLAEEEVWQMMRDARNQGKDFARIVDGDTDTEEDYDIASVGELE